MKSNHFVIFYDVVDYDGIISFYRDTMGFPIANSYDDGHKCGTMFSVNPMCDLEIMGAGKGNQQTLPAPEGVRLKFRVDDVDAEYERLQNVGVKIVDEVEDKHWNERSFSICAPDGLLIYVYSDI